MAPLHTQSVLGKDDKFTGEYSGKHPGMINLEVHQVGLAFQIFSGIQLSEDGEK